VIECELDVFESGFYDPDAPAKTSTDTRIVGLFGVEDGADEHGRVSKKGGSQIMHFTGLRRIGDCIATSKIGHVSPAMAELMFHRRGTCMRKCEKALFVYLAALHYLSKV
jgi:hypothetical protein